MKGPSLLSLCGQLISESHFLTCISWQDSWDFLLSLALFVWKAVTPREKLHQLFGWIISQMARTAETGPGQSEDSRTGFPTPVSGLMYLGHLLFSLVQQHGAWSAAEQLTLELVFQYRSYYGRRWLNPRRLDASPRKVSNSSLWIVSHIVVYM